MKRPSVSVKTLASLASRAAPWVGLAVVTTLWRRSLRAAPRSDLDLEPQATPEVFEAAEPGRGRLAGSPYHIPLRGWRDILWRTFKEIERDRLPAVAGGVTFYSLLALFPAIGVFVSLYGIFADFEAMHAQMYEMSKVIPSEVVNIIGDQMLLLASRPQASLSVAFLVSLLLSLWTANAGMKALFDGLNIAYGERDKRTFVKRTALTYGFTFAALVFLVVMTAILVAAPVALARVGLYELAVIWVPLRWMILVAMAAAAFSFIYRFAPCRASPRWRWVTIGGTFAACLWLGGSLIFSWYINNIAHFDVTYGALGAVIGFMMWIWFSVMVVLIGAELNAEIEHQTARDSTTGPELPLGARGAVMADNVGRAFHIGKFKDQAIDDGRRQVQRVRGILRR